ncbi:MAG: hypothetical protein L0206_21885 [Actinobacteria bacterium]|nr:hypothetical protein [Actinomycetota bacterium]
MAVYSLAVIGAGVAAVAVGCGGSSPLSDPEPPLNSAATEPEQPILPGRVAFNGSPKGSTAIWVAEADGTGTRRLTPPSDSRVELGPVWSPDGSALAFSGYVDDPALSGGADYDIYVVGADGTQLQNLTATREGGTGELSPVWSPDGRRIAYVVAFAGGSSIYVMGSDGAGKRRLTRSLGDYEPAWSPDGARIAFARTTGDDLSDIFTVTVAGAELERFTYTGRAWEPQWSPDGAAIVFVGADGDEQEIYTIDVAGARQRRLTSVPANDVASLAWSPDGTRIAFQAYADGNWDLWIVGVTDGALARVTKDPGDEVAPAWSPDGTGIAYLASEVPSSSRNNDGTFDAYVVQADRSAKLRLTVGVGALGGGLSWEPAP